MQYCTRCLNPANHPGGITFDDQGVCSACRVFEERQQVDWEKRWKLLEELVSHYRSKDGSNYDCVIGVSGGKDSHYIVQVVKERLHMNPLLVTYNHQYNTKTGLANLHNIVEKFDCDHFRFTQKPSVIKRLARVAMRKMGDFCWHCHTGIATLPMRIATQFNIPLVVWGDHGLQDQVGMFSNFDMVEYTKKVVNEHAKRGYDWQDFVGQEGLTKSDLLPFVYPEDSDIERVGVRGIYLANFIPWNAKLQSEELIRNCGFQSLPQQRTNNCYENVECWHCSGAHDYLKYLKYGYGRATDTVSYDIRFGRTTREEGIEFVKQYDSKRPKDIEIILKFLDMTEEEFVGCVDHMRDKRIWEKDDKGEWRVTDSVANHANDPFVNDVRVFKKSDNNYIETTPLSVEEFKHQPM